MIAYIGVGSNIEPEEKIKTALRSLCREVEVTKISMFYLTKPQGSRKQPDFINGVIEIKTPLPPSNIKFSILRKIERELGRARTGDPNEARALDLDLLVCGDMVIDEKDMKLPHPSIYKYIFVGLPLSEIAESYVLPDTNKRIKQIVEVKGWHRGLHGMKPLETFTSILKEELKA